MAERKVVPHRDTLWLSGADFVNLFLGVVIHVVLTRTLLSDDYGLFVLLLDLFHVCVIVVDLGLPTLIARDGGRLGNRLTPILHRVVSLQAVLMFSIVAVVALTAGQFSVVWKNPAAMLAFAAGLQVLAYSVRAALRANGEARLEAFIRIVDRAGVALLMVFWAGNLSEFAAASALGPSIALLLSLIIWKFSLSPRLEDKVGVLPLDGEEDTLESGLKIPREALPETADMNLKQLVNSGLPFMIAGAALVINVRIEKLLLGVFASPEDVAIFQIAWLGFIAGYGPILSLRAVFTSWFGEVRNDVEKLSHRYKKGIISCVILGLIGVGIGFLIGPIALDALFPEYAGAAEAPFNFLLLAWLFHAVASPSLALIQVGEKPWNYTRILWLGIAVSAVACLYLIPTQPNAVIGAAVAAVAGALVVCAFALTGVNRGLAPVNAEAAG